METYNVRETRENLSKIFKSGKTIEVRHPTHPVYIVPKDTYLELERELMNLQMDLAEARSRKKYSTEEVEAMIAQVMENKDG